jgi:glycosyltransferase involved in cell wall biosynthesis
LLFNNKNREKNKDQVNFLHLASTNPDYSSKNTNAVARMFDQFIRREGANCHLHIQGVPDKKTQLLIEKHTNISNISKVISREELSKLYKKSDCIIAPSSREGLSLALYEGLASGCKVITTDAEPMNYINTPYLCKTSSRRRDRSLVPLAVIDDSSLYQNIKRVYEDLKNE